MILKILLLALTIVYYAYHGRSLDVCFYPYINWNAFISPSSLWILMIMVENVKSQAAPQVGEPEPKHSVLAGGISVIGALAVPAARLAAQVSPVPGLGLAATLVENIFAIVEKLRYNKAQCRRLAESARDVVDAVNRAVHPSNPEDIDDGLKENVENLIR